jgi:hypothetical protein
VEERCVAEDLDPQDGRCRAEIDQVDRRMQDSSELLLKIEAFERIERTRSEHGDVDIAHAVAVAARPRSEEVNSRYVWQGGNDRRDRILVQHRGKV